VRPKSEFDVVGSPPQADYLVSGRLTGQGPRDGRAVHSGDPDGADGLGPAAGEDHGWQYEGEGVLPRSGVLVSTTLAS
jgi:hypothetical protein